MERELKYYPEYTMMELFLLEENPITLNPAIKTKEYIHTNIFGVAEHHLIAVHSVWLQQSNWTGLWIEP